MATLRIGSGLAQLQHGKIRFDAPVAKPACRSTANCLRRSGTPAGSAAPQLVLRGSLRRPRHTGTLQIDWRNLAAAEQGCG